jgi:hypothetical protein
VSSGSCRCVTDRPARRSIQRRVDLRRGLLQLGRRSRSHPPPMYCAGVPLIVARCPALTPPPSSLMSAVLSMLEAAVATMSIAGRSCCVPNAAAALKASPHASGASRVTPRAFTVELPFTTGPVGSVEFAYQLILRTNGTDDAVLTPGYLRKSYPFASAATASRKSRLRAAKHVANVECPSSSWRCWQTFERARSRACASWRVRALV